MLKNVNYYLDNELLKKTPPDPTESKSLLDKSERRLKRVLKEKVNDENSDLIFEDMYEVIREAAQAIMSLDGFKPYSHEATIAFLKEKYPQFEEYEIATMDRYRIIRNNSVYRGESIDSNQTIQAIEFSKKILAKIKKILAPRV